MFLTKPVSSSRARMHLSEPLCTWRGTWKGHLRCHQGQQTREPDFHVDPIGLYGHGFQLWESSTSHLVSFWLGLYYKGDKKPLEGLKQRGSLIQFKFYNLPQPAVWKMECVGICSAVVIVFSWQDSEPLFCVWGNPPSRGPRWEAFPTPTPSISQTGQTISHPALMAKEWAWVAPSGTPNLV